MKLIDGMKFDISRKKLPMKYFIISLSILFAISCNKTDKQELFTCKVNGIEAHSTSAIVSRDSSEINILAKLNNGYHVSFTVINWGIGTYELGYDYKYVEVVGNSEIYFLKTPSAGHGVLTIENTKGNAFTKRMDGSFQFTIGPDTDTPFTVTEGIFKNISIVDY